MGPGFFFYLPLYQVVLFERSEFLFDTSPQKDPSVCVSVCVRLILVLVWDTRLILVLVWSTYYVRIMYVCTWYQPAEITSCEKHSMVVYIHEPYPWAQSVVAQRWMEVTSWRPGAVDCTVWNEHHSTRVACRRPGPGAHRDMERGKVCLLYTSPSPRDS